MSPLHDAYKHWTTPHRVRVQTLIENQALLLVGQDEKKHPSQRQLFRSLNVPQASGHQITRSKQPRRLHAYSEPRGRKPKLTEADLRTIEDILWQGGFEARSLSWQSLILEAGLDCSARTLQRAMKQLKYRHCVACPHSWVAPDIAANRVEFAKTMLKKYPQPSDWYNVRFSDEVHLGFGSAARVWVTQKPGEVQCPTCTHEKRPVKEKDKKKVHTWGVIGYNYKSKLYRYNTNNSNGKMTQAVYLDLLKQETTDWPAEWALEEDRDSGHGKGKKNPVRAWKEAVGLKFYFNTTYSPDLAPIENAWMAPKAALAKVDAWDEETIWEVALEGWNGLSMKTINKWIDSMPTRLKAVIELEGQMCAF